MPNPSTYPYRRFPTIQVGAADHAARGTDAVKQELHALCAGSSKTVVTVECYPGTDQAEILALFPHAELVIHADDLAILPAELDAKIEHELTDDPVFGIMTTWQMKDFYPEEALCAARNKIDAVTAGLVLIYGAGASLVERADITIYADITRWEIQLRFRKGQDNWHTAMHDLPQRAKYKRGYFAEWRWGDRIKDKLLPVFDYYLDTTSAGNPAIVPGTAYRDALSKAAAQPFRMVPYFDPGVWGGDWMKTHFDLPENGSNYAWSFDGVPEENSLLLDFGSCVVETPALNLVYAHPRELLGDRVHARFGKEFPIRFDMLDTMPGQNLSLYTRQAPTRIGPDGELFMAPRIDDLECAATTLYGFLDAAPETDSACAPVWAMFDNEEVGSSTHQGADSSFLRDVLDRILNAIPHSAQAQAQAFANSFVLSADNAHAVHPNFADKADPCNKVILGKGVVVKVNASQKYTTSGLTGAIFKEICRKNNVPVQVFANRADLPGGSTLGNLQSHTVPVPMVDIGLAQLAMHSAVETAAVADADAMVRAVAGFYRVHLRSLGDARYTLE